VLAAAAVLAAAFGWYFTLVRRMVLPSVVLACAFACAAAGLAAYLVSLFVPVDVRMDTALTWVCVVVAAALAVWYRVFRVPFTMFLVGLTGLAFVYSITEAPPTFGLWGGMDQLFDLGSGSQLALGTLVFGLAAFAGAMAFDMRDPHRLGRRAASGFWLHLLAAPALVNTVALTFYNMQSALGWSLLALTLVLIALLAIVIDRRSFLTAGIVYFAVLLGFVLRAGDDDLSWIGIILILGLAITALGAFWTQARAGLMRALPDFPGKRRLPPFSESP
jgi:hypothetical protein